MLNLLQNKLLCLPLDNNSLYYRLQYAPLHLCGNAVFRFLARLAAVLCCGKSWSGFLMWGNKNWPYVKVRSGHLGDQ